MILIGESIHIISKAVSEAVRNRDAAAIQTLAMQQAGAGADYLDLNLGPARKDPEAVGSWLVNTVQEVTGLPISLDTMNPAAMEAGLALCKKRPILNSASGKAESKELMMPLAVKYKAQAIISVITDLGCPPDVDARAESIMETAAYANGLGISNEDIFVDPIILPVSADRSRYGGAKIGILTDCRAWIGSLLSRLQRRRPPARHTQPLPYLGCGLFSAIADVLDPELVRLRRSDIGLSARVMKVGTSPAAKRKRIC
jgi:5-methyltetrahydrofolate corrinoid/iron sulfur protein methyltransferase